MNKFVITILGFALLAAPTVVYADAASDYQRYLDASGVYNSAHNDYVTARANYLASGSIDSQDRALKASIAMLGARDNLIVTYLTALLSRVREAKGLGDSDRSSLSGQLSDDISWYSSHYNRLTSIGSLSDVVSDSDEAKERFNNLTVIAVYRTLVYLGAADNNNLRGQLNDKMGELMAKISEIKSNGDKDTSAIERSIVDVQNKLSRSQDKDNAARDLVNSIKPNSFGMFGAFSDSQQNLTDSQSYLREAGQGLLQIISQIKVN